MNDYLVSGTRQQYWEEYFVKHVMAVSITYKYYNTNNKITAMIHVCRSYNRVLSLFDVVTHRLLL